MTPKFLEMRFKIVVNDCTYSNFVANSRRNLELIGMIKNKSDQIKEMNRYSKALEQFEKEQAKYEEYLSQFRSFSKAGEAFRALFANKNETQALYDLVYSNKTFENILKEYNVIYYKSKWYL